MNLHGPAQRGSTSLSRAVPREGTVTLPSNWKLVATYSVSTHPPSQHCGAIRTGREWSRSNPRVIDMKNHHQHHTETHMLANVPSTKHVTRYDRQRQQLAWTSEASLDNPQGATARSSPSWPRICVAFWLHSSPID